VTRLVAKTVSPAVSAAELCCVSSIPHDVIRMPDFSFTSSCDFAGGDFRLRGWFLLRRRRRHPQNRFFHRLAIFSTE
jgi:hypothetical protein